MLNGQLHVLTLRRFIEICMTIHAIGTMLKLHVTQNILWLSVTMLPHERNNLSVHVLERIRHNRSAVSALESCLL